MMASKIVGLVDSTLPGLRMPDDILFFLAKYFLNNRDCLALALSGSSETFPSILGNRINLRKRLSISLCYFITPITLQNFRQQNIQSLAITTFDGSHCYWLPAEYLLLTTTQMTNLEELIIHDTKISLAHLPNIFSACQKIVKLSFSLKEKNLNQYQENTMEKASFDEMVRGFQQLTHVKIFTLAPSDYPVDFWPLTFGVLKWCHKCIDLHIEVAYVMHSIENLPPADLGIHNQTAIEKFRSELVPQLTWMSSLKSLVFIERGRLYFSSIEDGGFLRIFIKWLLEDWAPDLGRLWIPFSLGNSLSHFFELTPDYPTPLLSAHLPPAFSHITGNVDENTTQVLRHLQHLGVHVFSRLGCASEIKYVRGVCLDTYQGLNEFCQSHPMLEELHFDSVGVPLKTPLAKVVWNLPKLKTVVHRSRYPCREVLDLLIKCCPTIEALHLDCTQEYVTANPLYRFKFLGAIRFQNLRSLSLDGFPLADGSYLLPIVKQCPKLERLHISGIFKKRAFLLKLGECLPLATKLRDFGLQWRSFENDSVVTDFLRKLLKCSSRLERLVLNDQHDYDRFPRNHPPYDMGDFLFNFISKMDHLVALCFASFRIHPDVFKELNRRVTREIVPLRPPSFWFHLGPKLPNANDSSVPRVHSDEIVHPIYWFHSPPKFDWYCPPS